MASQLHRRAALAVAASVIVLACSGSEGGVTTPPDPTAPPVDTFSVEIVGPDSVRVSRLTVKYEAVIQDQCGRLRPEVIPQWLSDNPAVLAPDAQNGWMVVHSTGEAALTVRARGAIATRKVFVTRPPIETLLVKEDRLAVTVNGTASVGIVALDSVGAAALDLVTVTVRDTTIAVGDGRGRFTGVAVGSTVAHFFAQGLTDTLHIDVAAEPVTEVSFEVEGFLPTGSTRQLQLLVRGAAGTVLDDRSVRWGSSDPSVATITDSGSVTGVGEGRTVLHAEVEGVRAEAELEVRNVVGRIDIEGPSELRLGDSHEFGATVYGPAGNVLPIAPEWSLTDTSVAELVGGSTVHALDTGWVYLRAESGGLVASHLLQVLPSPGSVEIGPFPTLVRVGSRTTATATVRGPSGEVIPGAAVGWSTVPSEGVLRVLTSGIVEAVAPGRALLIGSYGSVSDTVDVEVRPEPASMVLSGLPDPLRMGGDVQLVVEVRDATGVFLPDEKVTWTADGTLTVDAVGRIRATAVGAGTVTATLKGLSTSASVRTIPPSDAIYRILPDTLVLRPNQAGAFENRVLDSELSIIEGAGEPSIEISDTTVAQRAPDGSIVGISPGTTVVLFSWPWGAIATGVVRVEWQMTGVRLTPMAAAVGVGRTLRLQAAGVGADGSERPLEGGVWTSENPAVAVVDSFGLVSGVSPGTSTISVTADGFSAGSSIRVVDASPKPARIDITPGELDMAPGETAAVIATAFDVAGAVISGTVFSWTSSDPATVAVDSGGRVSAVSPGSATLTAEALGLSAEIAVRVTPEVGPAVSLTLSPRELELWPSPSGAFTVTAVDSAGISVPVDAVEFTSLAPDVFSIDSVGVVRALASRAVGRAVATMDGLADTARVRVGPILDSVVVADRVAGIVGDSVVGVFQVWGRYGRLAYWDYLRLTFPAGLARLSGELNPAIELLEIGEGVIGWETYDGELSGTVPLIIEEVRWQGLQVGGAAYIPAGDSMLFVLRGETQFGGALRKIREVEEWSSSDESIATVGVDGRVRALAPGTVTITGRVGTASASLAVEVTRGRISSLAAIPRVSHAVPGDDVAIEVRAVTDLGDTIAVHQDRVLWQTYGVPMPATGRFRVGAAGFYPINPNWNGIWGWAGIAVRPTPAGSASQTFEFVATQLHYGQPSNHSIGLTGYLRAWRSDGGLVPLGEMVWSSSRPEIGIVDQEGVFTRLASGTTVVTATWAGRVAQIEIR